MKERLIKFVLENNLSPFNPGKSLIKGGGNSIYKTRDAKAIHTKVLSKISSKFIFSETVNLWNCFDFTDDINTIKQRQEFFRSLELRGSGFLREIKRPRITWKPRYDIVAVTEDESTFIALNKLGCGAQLLVSENDVMELERYDIIQVVDCSDFKILLERLPQSVFVDSVENIYLERYLEELSGWRENFSVLNRSSVSENMRGLLKELEPMFNLLENKEGKIITESEVERILEEVNEVIGEKIKEMTISGEGLMKMLSEGKMPANILEIVREAIEASGLSEHIFNLQIPVTIDYKELEEQIKRQSANEFTDMAERVKRSAEELKRVSGILERLSALLLVEDFCMGISQWINSGDENKKKQYPTYSENLHFSDASNMFLNNAQSINFQLDNFNRCSILTGANSGGKTTLLEHVLQDISLFQLGLPICGEIHLPIFSDVYYFAKTKGSTSKGAFETLLTQMSKIQPGNKSLILADEIEAVTEPGVAGKIISATAEFFIKKNCFMILATHLGAEIQKNLPNGARIDGIEAKGLDENFNLIVNHNPVLGRLAHSTPELIVERMANNYPEEYFKHLYSRVKN
ncbi:MAG: hypothetical protein ABIF18_02510 [archaeon]